MPEEYKGLPIIEIKTQEVNIKGKSAKGFTKNSIVGDVFVGCENGDWEGQAVIEDTLKEFREDANFIAEKIKLEFGGGEDLQVRVKASTMIKGYGQAEDIKKIGDVIGCALNRSKGYYSGFVVYHWPDWFAKEAIFVVDNHKFIFMADEYDFEDIALSDEQLKALKAAL